MRTPAFACVCLLGLACTPGGAEPEPVVPSAPAATAEPPPVAVEEPGPAPAGAVELHPVALREGGMLLVEAGGEPYVVIDGEPVPLAPGRAPARVPELGRGLAPIESMFGPMFEVVDLVGDLAGRRGYLVVREDFDRAGSEHHVYELGDAGWKLAAGRKYGTLREYYTALASTPAVQLGLRAYELGADAHEFEYEDDSKEAQRFWNKVQADLASAPTGFVVLSGSSAATPKLPADYTVHDLVGLPAGRIIALAHQRKVADDQEDSGPLELLDWAPGQATPSRIALPDADLDRIYYDQVELLLAGDRVIVSGIENGSGELADRPYLAVGDAQGWVRVPVELPGADEPVISSATIAPDGELWLTSVTWSNDGPVPPTLWRQSAGAWQPVALPSVDALTSAADANERFAYDPIMHEWLDLPASEGDGEGEAPRPIAKSVLWSGGALWVVAELGPAYSEEGELYIDERRTVVFANKPVDAPVWLTAFDRLQLERSDHAARSGDKQPGGPGCREFTIVVSANADGSPDATAKLVAKLEADEPPSVDGAYVRELFIGATVDGSSGAQLVYTAVGEAPKHAKALVEQVGERAGVTAGGDCRPRELLRRLD